MKKGFISVVVASAVLGAASMAFAGAYHEAEQPEEIPAPAPAPPPVMEPEPERVMHKFDGFLTDAETTRGIWGELGAVYATEYHPSNVGDVEAVNTYAHVSYGKEMFEVGAMLPYIYVHQDTIGEAHDIGDLRLWGKVIPWRTDVFALGGGLIVSFPTAGEDQGTNLGTDEYGFQPFLTFGVEAGPASIRVSAGYNVFTEVDVYDRTDLNVGALFPIGDRIVLRGELIHNHLTDSHADPLSFIPGVDFLVPIGSVELVLRPTVGVGITQAPDWQAGLGIAVSVPNI